ncbi:MAG TPA: GntR family transcriptional regulator, partial [Ktedonobacterales bacterium]|nr:GntR family transcriptional regulator [Ktedonobacterales bacterium]
MVPLYQQIAAHIKEAIMRGTLREQERLPPIRTLARTLGVSQITVTLSYELLAKEGFITSHVGRGTFISPRRHSDDNSGRELPESPDLQKHSADSMVGAVEDQSPLPGLSRTQWLLSFHQATLLAQQAIPPLNFSEA